jgi:hypothetical protein
LGVIAVIFPAYCEKGVELGTFMPLSTIAWRIDSLVSSRSCSFSAMVKFEAAFAEDGTKPNNNRNATK